MYSMGIPETDPGLPSLHESLGEPTLPSRSSGAHGRLHRRTVLVHVSWYPQGYLGILQDTRSGP